MEVIRCVLRGQIRRRKTGVQGEEIVQDLLNFSDWECNRVGQKWLGFPSGLGVREYWVSV